MVVNMRNVSIGISESRKCGSNRQIGNGKDRKEDTYSRQVDALAVRYEEHRNGGSTDVVQSDPCKVLFPNLYRGARLLVADGDCNEKAVDSEIRSRQDNDREDDFLELR